MNEQDVQQQIIQLVQAAMQGDQLATQQIQLIMQAAQQGDQQAVLLAQLIQLVMEQMQGSGEDAGMVSARQGAKLNYINQLRGRCPEGTVAKFYREGGRVCKKCEATMRDRMKTEMPSDPIEAFKKGRKLQAEKDCAGAKVKLACNGSKTKKK